MHFVLWVLTTQSAPAACHVLWVDPACLAAELALTQMAAPNGRCSSTMQTTCAPQFLTTISATRTVLSHGSTGGISTRVAELFNCLHCDRFSPNCWESYCSEAEANVNVIGLLLVCLSDSLGAS